VVVIVGRGVAVGWAVCVAEGEGDAGITAVGVAAVFPHPMSMMSRKKARKSCFLEASRKCIRLGYWRIVSVISFSPLLASG
jgi:hypothetical protein